MYPIKDREDLKDLNELAFLRNEVEENRNILMKQKVAGTTH